ncbi:MAG: flagellar motor switch phosphatase FliY, partial [Clostridiales bacterium]|nr:flagellar motor switch phosphatase FliY [Clostridiales bacterium]
MTDMLSQEEINALLGGAMGDPDEASDDIGSGEADNLNDMLTAEEKDVLGELGNISIGTSATTLFALLGQRVIITTPKVNIVKLKDIGENYEKPCVAIRVDYTEGIKGTNVLLLNHHDVKVITSLMMGWGDENIDTESDLNDMDISAIQEAMNQMIGSASTSLASLVNTKIDIATPKANVIDFNSQDLLDNLGFDEDFAVAVEFRMEIGTLVDSNIMQLLPMDFARHMVGVMTSTMMPEEAAPPPKPAAAA